MTDILQPRPRRRYHELRPFRDEAPFKVFRWWLNVLFILGAIVGMAVWHWYSRDWGTWILIVASVLKFIELALRMTRIFSGGRSNDELSA